MKNKSFLLLWLSLVGIISFAQKPDFSGKWKLDKAKSKLDERTNTFIESQVLSITQTPNSISLQYFTNQSNTDNANKSDVGGSMNVYSFDGKETGSTMDTQLGSMDVVCKGSIKNDQVILNTVRTVSGRSFKSVTNDVLILSEDGNTLTIKRSSENQLGTILTEWVFVKVN